MAKNGFTAEINFKLEWVIFYERKTKWEFRACIRQIWGNFSWLIGDNEKWESKIYLKPNSIPSFLKDYDRSIRICGDYKLTVS